MIAATQERIKTTNEKWGSCQAPPDEGGAWAVEDELGHVLCICSNREAAEAAFRDKSATHTNDELELSVWTIHDTWPPKDED